MALFDQLGKKLAQTGQSAVKKTKDMAEVAKINSMISDEEKSINNNYYQIGKLYVSMHGNDCEDDFKGMLESIRQSEKKIVEYKEQVQLIKGVVRCEKCGGEVSINSAFCNSCGAPMPRRVPVQTYDEDTIKCDKCGKYVKRECVSAHLAVIQCRRMKKKQVLRAVNNNFSRIKSVRIADTHQMIQKCSFAITAELK